MKLRLAAVAVLALAAGAASAQPPAHDAPRGPGFGHGAGGFGLLQFDANADGKITKAEFDAALKARFDKIDANKDGSATHEEFQAAGKAEMEAHRSEMVKARFAELDKDKNGQLSQSEFAAGAPGMDGDGPPRGEGRRRGMRGPGGSPPPFLADGGPGRDHGGPDGPDGPSDGKVTFTDFGKRPAEAFAKADANKDGTVTIAELQALHGSRR